MLRKNAALGKRIRERLNDNFQSFSWSIVLCKLQIQEIVAADEMVGKNVNKKKMLQEISVNRIFQRKLDMTLLFLLLFDKNWTKNSPFEY
jgi:hypothetical protein